MVVMIDENTWNEERNISTSPLEKDIRTKYAEQIYDIIEQDKQKDEHYIYVVPKETRAGATTSLTSVAINKGLPIVVIEPMLRIVKETVGLDGIRYSDKPGTKMHYVYSNRKCALIQAMIAEIPELKTIPIILLPQRCFKCDNYESCEFTAVMRDPKPDVIAISYKKLIHVNAGSVKKESVPEELLNVLLKSDVFLFDEIHEMQNLPPATLPILYFNKTTGISVSLCDFDKYYKEIKDLKFKYPFLYNMLERCKKIIKSSEVLQSIQKVLDNALSESYFEKHISVQLINPLIDRVDVCEKDSFKTSLGFFNDIFNIVVNRDYGRLTINTLL
jgi:hypothetical protein